MRLARLANDPVGIRAASIRPEISLGFEVLPSLLVIDAGWAEPNLSDRSLAAEANLDGRDTRDGDRRKPENILD
ncbi:MAG: hypothetical protein AMXMBFR36_08060 [Acidobacteriota bacterium]